MQGPSETSTARMRVKYYLCELNMQERGAETTGNMSGRDYMYDLCNRQHVTRDGQQRRTETTGQQLELERALQLTSKIRSPS